MISKKKGYKGSEGKYDWKNLGKATVDAIPALSLIVVVIGGIIGVSNILGWVMAFTQIPQAISNALLGLTDNQFVILLIMNLILLETALLFMHDSLFSRKNRAHS